MPEGVGGVEEFDIEGVVIADHDDRILFVFVDKLDFGDGVLDQELPLQGVVVVLDVFAVVGLHALQKAFAACLHQFLWLSSIILTEQLMRTFIPFSISFDLM